MDHYEFFVAAERKYAIALAHYEVAEHATEVVVGLKALTEADHRIQLKKLKLRDDMNRIARSIRKLCDPEWTPGHIKPLHVRTKTRKAGEVSKAAYAIMRQEQREMSSWELAALVAERLGVAEAGNTEMTKIAVAIRSAMERRAQDDQIIKHPGKPIRWSIKPLASRASARARPTPARMA
jgi:hypothetical protein